MTSSLPPRQALTHDEQQAFQNAVHQRDLAVASPFLAEAPSVLDTWHTIAKAQPDAFHHWQEEFVAYLPTHWTLADIEDRLAVHNQTLHLDYPPQWTLAQAFAYAPPLPSDVWQMPLRKRVLGLHWLDAQGQIISSGGRVLKNVTGYDLHRLHLGFHGTLGIPIGVCLRTSAVSISPKRFFQWKTSQAEFSLLEKGLKMSPPTGLEALSYAEETAYLTWQGSDELLNTCFSGFPLNEQAQAFTAPLAPLWRGDDASPLWQAKVPEALWQQWRDLRRAWGITPEQLRSPYFEEGVYNA
jgi:glycolate oxidase FAD binding subunit